MIRSVTALVMLAASASPQLHSHLAAQHNAPQQPRSPSWQAELRQAPLTITGPTLVVILPAASDTSAEAQRRWLGLMDSVITAAREVARSVGFEVAIRAAPGVVMRTADGSAMHYPPRRFEGGYILIHPSLRPRVLHGFRSSDDLREALRAYGRPAYPSVG